MTYFYALWSLLGIGLPFSQFIPWVQENGLNIPKFIREAGQSRLSAFAWLDVIVSAVVLIGFIIVEGRRLKMKRLWLPIAGTCTVGVSFGLPLFLWLRELHLTQ